jgi:hypothetical protein
MASDERAKHLEAEIVRLREKEKKLEHDLALYRQIFEHLKAQFDEMKRELTRKP